MLDDGVRCVAVRRCAKRRCGRLWARAGTSDAGEAEMKAAKFRLGFILDGRKIEEIRNRR
jgi:hypothetical protein